MKKSAWSLFLFLLVGCLAFSFIGCASTAPLPVTLNIVPPASDVPPEIAAFSGIWNGQFWNGLETKLVVEKIDNNKAELIISFGLYPGHEPSYVYQTAKVSAGPVIKFTAPNGDTFEFKIDKSLKEIKLTLIEKRTGANLWAVYKRATN